LSTGEFRATEFTGADAERRIQDELEQLRPKELLYASSAPLFDKPESGGMGAPPVQGRQTVAPPAGRSSTAWALTPLDDWIFAPDHAIPLLENQFGVLSLEGFGLAGKPAAAAAAGAILHYVRTTQRGSMRSRNLNSRPLYAMSCGRRLQGCLIWSACSAGSRLRPRIRVTS